MLAVVHAPRFFYAVAVIQQHTGRSFDHEDIVVVLVDIKRGACLLGEFAVAVERRLGIAGVQACEELFEGFFLLLRACVLGCLAVGGHTTDVADADGIAIVPGAVCSLLGDGASGVDAAVAIDDVVIPDIAEASLEVPLSDLSDGEVLSFGCGGAVDDDFCDGAHDSFILV